MNDFMRVAEAAKVLNVSPSSVRRYVALGQINYKTTPGGQRVFTQDDLDEEGDEFTSVFSLTEVPWVNADDYTGTVTYTATAN